ncbi:ly6/PLAUR domain-containing protein 2-like [Pleurodeles waltl]|uniref:ly6/PLAUR domain-containing protein 2-like n=1 Tax=Pleurodeles waltl TaxID=8319 RepID=UPI003709B7D1
MKANCILLLATAMVAGAVGEVLWLDSGGQKETHADARNPVAAGKMTARRMLEDSVAATTLARALECYVCTDARSPHGCITPIKCKEDEPFCKTNLTISDGALHITKLCASTCSPTMGRATTISCCNEYLCNVAPFKNLDQGGKLQKEGLLLRVGT